jgi:Sec-independent protein translocase protein TatA
VISFLLVIVVIVVVGASALAYRSRPESSIESGIRSFRREMRALAPPPEHRRGPQDGPPVDAPPRDVE